MKFTKVESMIIKFIDDMEEEAKDIIWPSIELSRLRKRLMVLIEEIKKIKK